MSNERAYLRRYADAAGTLAELAMVPAFPERHAVYYDDDAGEYVVVRQWREAIAGLLDEEEVARHSQFPDAVEAAYERWRAAHGATAAKGGAR